MYVGAKFTWHVDDQFFHFSQNVENVFLFTHHTYTHAFAVLDNASLKCWGGNEQGSLGLGDKINRGVSAGEMGDNLLPVALTFGPALGNVSNVYAGRLVRAALLIRTAYSNSVGHYYCA